MRFDLKRPEVRSLSLTKCLLRSFNLHFFSTLQPADVFDLSADIPLNMMVRRAIQQRPAICSPQQGDYAFESTVFGTDLLLLTSHRACVY